MDHENTGNMIYDEKIKSREVQKKQEREFRKCCSVTGGIVALTVLAFNFFPYLFMCIYPPAQPEDSYYGFTPAMYQAYSCMIYFVCVGAPSIIYLIVSRQDARKMIPLGTEKLKFWIPGILAGVLVCQIANKPSYWVSDILELFWSGEGGMWEYTDSGFWSNAFYFVSAAVIPPIVEEVMFRGIILQKLRKYGTWFAVIGSSVLFAMFHGDFSQGVFAFICGIGMAFLTIKTGSIIPAVIVHFINNGVSAAADLVGWFGTEWTANSFNNFSSQVILGLGIMGFLILKLQDRDFYRLEDNKKTVIPLADRMAGFCVNIGVGAAYLLFLTESVMALFY